MPWFVCGNHQSNWLLCCTLLDFWCWNESIMPIDTTALCESNGCKCIGLQINPWLSGANRYVQCYRSNVMPNHDVVPHNGIECKCNAILSNAHAQCKAKTTMYTGIPWKLKNFTVPMQPPTLPFNLLQLITTIEFNMCHAASLHFCCC